MVKTCYPRLLYSAFIFTIIVSRGMPRVMGESINLPFSGSPVKPDLTNAKERHFPNDTRSICFNSRHQDPKIYYVSQSSVKCVSQDPIRWNISFYPPPKEVRMTRVPYDVTLEWKSCGSVHQSQWNIPGDKIYYNSIVEFNHSNDISSRVNWIFVRCTSIKNGTFSSTSWRFQFNESRILNLAEGHEGVNMYNVVKRPQPLCDDLALAADTSRSNLICLKETRESLKTSSIQHIKCHDWINCQQLGVDTMQNTCRGIWSPQFCDSHPRKCERRDELVRINSGIIFCQGYTSDPIFYMLFFKIQFNITTTKVNHIISDLEKDSEGLVTLTRLENTGAETVFECSSPTFIALAGFQWSAVYTNMSNGDATKDCNITRNDTDESYIEKLIYKIPVQQTSSGLKVTCTVYLQSGHVLIKTVTPKHSFESEGTTAAGTDSVPIKYLIAAVVGCFLAIVPVLAICYCKIRRQKKQIDFSAEEMRNFMEGIPGPNALSPNRHQSATVLPYDVTLEVPRNQIRMESKLLGQGAFGKVMKGRIKDRPVAIKTTNKNIDGQYFRALLSELKIMAFVGKHVNVVELVGANTARIRKQDVYLIFEYCDNGNVLEYIRSRRDVFIDQYSHDVKTLPDAISPVQYANGANNRLCSEDLVQWSVEISEGMEFISSKKVYHGDLAARNILLTRNLVAKVGDFGLARELEDYSLYVQQAGCPLPLKWMAIESLRDLEFSIQSDVWSFGITLWEIFSLGSTPYPGIEWNFQAWKRLQDGERMERALHATESIHAILLKCWEGEPNHRPSFAELKQMLKSELAKLGPRRRTPRGSAQPVQPTVRPSFYREHIHSRLFRPRAIHANELDPILYTKLFISSDFPPK